jgi:hypothetical protein
LIEVSALKHPPTGEKNMRIIYPLHVENARTFLDIFFNVLPKEKDGHLPFGLSKTYHP